MQRSCFQKKSVKKGSVLIEALLSVVILSVSITFIIQSMMASLRATMYVGDYTTAIFLMENKMTELLQKKYTQAPLTETGTVSDQLKDYQYSVKAESIDASEEHGVDDVQVEMFWQSGKKENRITVNTYVLWEKTDDEQK